MMRHHRPVLRHGPQPRPPIRQHGIVDQDLTIPALHHPVSQMLQDRDAQRIREVVQDPMHEVAPRAAQRGRQGLEEIVREGGDGARETGGRDLVDDFGEVGQDQTGCWGQGRWREGGGEGEQVLALSGTEVDDEDVGGEDLVAVVVLCRCGCVAVCGGRGRRGTESFDEPVLYIPPFEPGVKTAAGTLHEELESRSVNQTTLIRRPFFNNISRCPI